MAMKVVAFSSEKLLKLKFMFESVTNTETYFVKTNESTKTMLIEKTIYMRKLSF